MEHHIPLDRTASIPDLVSGNADRFRENGGGDAPGPTRLGKLVARARKRSGASQRQLARDAGMDIATLSRLEQGVYASPTPTTLRRLARALEIGLVELYRAAGYVEHHDLLHIAKEITTQAGLPEETARRAYVTYANYLAEAHGLQLDQTTNA